MSFSPPTGRHEFHVAFICALPIEANCVEALFDKFWEDERIDYGKAAGDSNAYTTGMMTGHNVVLVHMPGMGKVNAASVAANLRSSFRNIRLALLVGICGGVPQDRAGQELILGDVVISQSLVQYDFGRQYPGEFARKTGVDDSLGRPSPEIRAILAKLQTNRSRERMQLDILQILQEIEGKLPEARYPGLHTDKLYRSSFVHRHQISEGSRSCTVCSETQVCSKARSMGCEEVGCSDDQLVQRIRTTNTDMSTCSPMVHVGKLGSGDMVMKSGELRDKMAAQDNILAFEMEGAGLWEYFPSLVVKGICDYADSHKNKVWQSFAAATAACCAKSLLKLWTAEDPQAEVTPTYRQQTQLSVVVPTGQQKKCIWHVPFDQMPDFVGREDEIQSLKSKLFGENHTQKMAVFGLGGIGKSRVAWEIASHARSLSDYSVLWVEATNISTLEKDFLEIGKRLQIPALKNIDQGLSVSDNSTRDMDLRKGTLDIKRIVKEWLSSESAGNWFMILDNADDESVWIPRKMPNNEGVKLADYIPKSKLGAVLVTTRSRRVAIQLAGPKNVVPLHRMSATEGARTLNQLLAIAGDGEGPESQISELVHQLSYLPLAIVQAAAYINLNEIQIHEYIELLNDVPEEDMADLLDVDFEDETRYSHSPTSVVSTWLISFTQIQKSHPQAIDLLSYMSCLNEKDIPRTLLPDSMSKKEFLETVVTLTSYSFIRKQPQARNTIELYDMHRLVRLATRNWLRKENKMSSWVAQAVKHVTKAFPGGELLDRTTRTLYMPHAIALCFQNDVERLDERCRLIEKMSQCLIGDGAFELARDYLSKALEWRIQHDGETALTTLQTRSELGRAFLESGLWKDAATHTSIALHGKEEQLGYEQPSTIVTRGHLATIYCRQGKWQDAERLETEVLNASTKLFGPEHQNTLASMGGLATIYLEQGRFDEAAKLELRVMESNIRLNGPEDRHTLASKFELARTYTKLKRFDEAMQLNLEAMEAMRRVIGTDHPYTLSTIIHLSEIFAAQKKWEDSESLLFEALEITQRVYGSEHPQTMKSLTRLAGCYYDQKRFEDALNMDEQALEMCERLFGRDSPETLTRMDDVASTLKRLGNMEDACYLLSDCVDFSISTLGPAHEQTKRRRARLRRWLELDEFPVQTVVHRSNSF